MRKLKGIVLQNFQSHKSTRVRFAPLITTFVGESNNGKTSILRGIKLVVKNEPRGTEFISAKATKSTVTLILEDNTEVTREKTKSVNRYSISYPDGSNQEYDNFGNDIPSDILDVLQSKPVKIDTDFSIDLNFSEQLDGPFLLGEKDHNKAKIIDGLARINVFNVALRNVNSRISSLNLEEKSNQRQLQDIEEMLKQYEDLDDAEVRLQKLQVLIQQIQQLQQRKELLQNYYDQYHQLNQAITATKEMIQKFTNIRSAGMLIQNLQLLEQKNRMLTNIRDNLFIVRSEKEKSLHILSKKNDLIELNNLYENLISISDLKSTIEGLQQQYVQNQEAIKANRERISKLQLITQSEEKVIRLRTLFEQKERLFSLFQQWRNNQDGLIKGRSFVQRLYPLTKAEEYIQQLTSKISKQEELIRLHSSFTQNQQQIATGKQFCNEKRTELENYKEEYTQTLLQFNQCPVCFSVLDEKHIEHLKSNL